MAKNSSIILDIGAKIDKTWQASMSNISTDINKLGRLIHNNMKMFDDGKKSISNYTKEIDKLKEKINSTLMSAGSKNFVNQKQITPVKNKLTRAQKSGKDTTELEAQLSSLKSFENLKIDSPIRAKILAIMDNITLLENKMHEAETNIEQAPKNIAKAFKQYIGNVALKAVTSVIGALGQLGRTGVKMLGKLAGVFGKTVERAIGLEQAIRLIVQYGFGFRSLYYLVRRLRTGIEQGFEYLGGAIKSSKRAISGFSEEVGKLLETLKELLYYLKSAAAAMLQPFMPLINSIIPKLVEWFNALSIAVANFIATLTGQSKIYVASTNLEDYANALDQVAGSADKAKKALGAYDKLNVIHKDKNGGGGSTLDTSGWFSEQDVEPSELAKKIKEAWEKADFTQVGVVIGEKFKAMLEGIDWDGTIFPMIERIAKSVATFINGFVSVDGLGAEIGKTIANIFNGITDYVLTFASTLDWSGIGKFIVEGINKFLTTFDAAQAGSALYTFADGILTMLGTIFTTIDSTQLGKDIGTFFENLNIPDLVGKLYNVAKQFVSAFAEALKSWALNDPESFGLAAAITLAMSGVNLVGGLVNVGLTLSTAGILDGGMIGQTLTDIGLAISNFFTVTIPSLFMTAKAGLASLFGDGFMSILTSVLSTISSFLSTAILPIVTILGAGLVGEIANSWDEGLTPLQNILIGLGNAWDNLYYNIIEPIVNLIKAIVVPIWNTLQDVFMNLVGALLTSVIPVCQIVATTFSEVILPAIKGVIDFITNAINFLMPVITTVISIIGDILTVVVDIVGGIIKIVTPFVQVIISFIGGIIAVINNVIGVIGDLLTHWSDVWEGIKDIVRSAVNWVINMINGLLSGLQNMINNIVNGINSLLSFDIPDWVPFVGGKSLEVNLHNISIPQIPTLAQGAVIPPNRQFLAMLGDQSSGVNVEAPLDTIKQALVEALAESSANAPIVLQLDGKVIAKTVWDENEKRYKQLGKYAY